MQSTQVNLPESLSMKSTFDIELTPLHIPTVSTQSEPLTPLLTPEDDNKHIFDQTAAGTALLPPAVMPHSQRPQTQPVQDVFDLSDESSSSSESVDTMSSADSTDSASSGYSEPPLDLIRCSRCHNNSFQGAVDLQRGSMVSYGTNLYYCRRCAKVVGYSGSRVR